MMTVRLYLCTTTVLLIIHFVTLSLEFQMHISDEDDATFCKHKYHYILKPKATCCNMTVIKPGIDIEKHLEECGKPGDENENIFSASWRIYGCILKAAAGTESEITLEKFSELMTQNYDEVWKKPITDKVASITKSAAYGDMKGLNAIRVAYFDIENQICSGMGSNEVDLKERECVHWEEENHRGGSCCGKESYPIDINLGNFLLWVTFPVAPGQCKTVIKSFMDAAQILETMRNDIALICDFSCILIANDLIDLVSPKYWDRDILDVADIATFIFPEWLSSKAKKEAVEYISSNINVTERYINMEGYEFPSVVRTNATVEKEQGVLVYVHNITDVTISPNYENKASELMRRTFPQNILFFPTMCDIHMEILYLTRNSLYMNCDKEPIN